MPSPQSVTDGEERGQKPHGGERSRQDRGNVNPNIGSICPFALINLSQVGS